MVKYLKNNTLFVPTRDIHWDATKDDDYDVDNIFIDIDKDKLHGWFFRPTGDFTKTNKVFFFLHGNYGNISYRQILVDLIVKVYGYPMLIFDYRGYGQSTGQATLDNIKVDSDTMYRYLTQTKGYKEDDIILWGKSLGGYGASYLASKHRVHSLVLMYTFSTFKSVMENKQLFSAFIDMFMGGCTSNVEHIKSCKAKKVCFVHSKTDGLIPYKCSIELMKNCNIDIDNKKIITIEGTHSKPVITLDNFKEICRHVDALPLCRIDDGELKLWLEKLQNIEILQQAIPKNNR